MKKINSKRSLGLLAALLCFFILGGVTIEQLGGFTRLKSILQITYVPAELLCYNKLGDLLRRLNLIHVTTNNSERYKVSRDQLEPVSLNAFQKRRQVSNALLSLEPDDEKMRQALDVAESAAPVEGELLISVVTDEKNLTGQDGILTNFEERGRSWEKLAYAAIYEGEKLLVQTPVGLRLHGGKSRLPSLPHHSFRLYFKKKYGTKEIPPKLIFPTENPVRTLVVHVDFPDGWPFNSIIANKIYKKVGNKTMEYRPAQFYLNGKFEGIYWVSEHLSKKYLRNQLETNDFISFKFRGTRPKGKYHLELDKLAIGNNKLTVENVKNVLNIDDITNYFIALSFCGTTDWWNQGVVYKVNNIQDKRWHWIVWDVDHSFADIYKRDSKREVWQQPGIDLFFDRPLKRITLRQYLIFRRLLRDDPYYKHHFINEYINTLNHKLTSSYLMELYKEHEILAKKFGISLNPLLKDFLTKRGYVIRKQLTARMSVPPFYKMTLHNHKLDKFHIDGYLEEGNYHGFYPKGFEVTLRPAKTNTKKILYWTVNGEKIFTKELRIIIDRKTMIEAIYQDSSLPNSAKS